VLLLDILADVVSDTLAGERLLAALRRQFVEDKRTTSLDVRHALERRRKREATARQCEENSDGRKYDRTTGTDPALALEPHGMDRRWTRRKRARAAEVVQLVTIRCRRLVRMTFHH
jgi:hypothetical protein